MPFIFKNLEIKDIILIEPKIFEDERGFFSEAYKKSDFVNAGIKDDFVQTNVSFSKKHVLRGLHYQTGQYAQSKLVRCETGRIIDVAVDIRENSPAFKKYVKVELSEKNRNMLYIPKGFAHGFVVISDFAKVVYKTANEYNPQSERGILWNDKTLGIDWEIDFEPVLSRKDKKNPDFKDIDFKEAEL